MAEKIREYARPARRWPFRRATPRWLERLRSRSRIAARLEFLDRALDDR